MARKEPGEPYTRISSEEANEMVQKGNSVVVDVRQPDEYKDGHVAGALFIPVDDIMNRIGELPDGKDLLFICAAGVRSGLACEMAAAMGVDSERLYNIEEGTPTWIGKDLPTSYGDEL